MNFSPVISDSASVQMDDVVQKRSFQLISQLAALFTASNHPAKPTKQTAKQLKKLHAPPLSVGKKLKLKVHIALFFSKLKPANTLLQRQHPSHNEFVIDPVLVNTAINTNQTAKASSIMFVTLSIPVLTMISKNWHD